MRRGTRFESQCQGKSQNGLYGRFQEKMDIVPPIEIAWLRFYLFAIHPALPGARIERKIVLDVFEPLGRLLIGPDPVLNRLLT